MANLADSAVAYESQWTDGGISSKRHVEMVVILTLTAQGTVANKILASNFGLINVERCGNAVLSDNTVVYNAVPSFDGTFILLSTTAGAPLDVTGTVRMFVAGYR